MKRKRNVMAARAPARSNQRRKVLKHNLHKKIVSRRKAFAMASMIEIDTIRSPA